MKISTKGRYALRIILDIAENQKSKYGLNQNVSVKKIAERQQISEKYLEGIVAKLHKRGLVQSERGKYGGYQLTKSPANITVYDVLVAADEKVAIVTCLEQKQIKECEHKPECRTLKFWSGFQEYIHKYLEAITVQDIIVGELDPIISCVLKKREEVKPLDTIEERCRYGDL